MNVILDVAVAAIVIVSVILGVKRGFFKTFAGLVCLIATLALVLIFAEPLGLWANEKFVSPAIANGVVEKLDLKADSAIESVSDDKLMDNKLFAKIVNKEGTGALQNERLKNAGASVKDFVVKILSDNAALSALCVLIAALVIIIAVRLVLWLLQLIFKPMLKNRTLSKINRFMGFVIGLASALVLTLVFCVTVQRASNLYTPKTEGGTFRSEVVDNTAIYKYALQLEELIDKQAD